MNREIKFRAWSISDGVMEHIQDLYWFEECGVHNITACKAEGLHSHYNIMQFTGLQDKNGVDIYEGDIVYAAGTGLCRVQYVSNQARFGFFDKDGFDWDYCDIQEDLEDICGNIHENPGLLESQS